MSVDLDESQLLALAGDDRGFLVSVVEEFRENSLQLVEQMGQACVREDWEGFKKLVHQLKGTSGSLGMVSLHALAVRLEEMAREGGVAEVCVEELRDLLDLSVQLAFSCLEG